jgi:signal peptidase I
MSAESVVKPEANPTSPASKPRGRSPSFRQQISQCLLAAVIGAFSYYLVSHYVFQNVQVVGESMVPTLYDSQQYLLNRWIYHFRDPKRAEVVVLKDPQDKGFAVKRIIGAAGDRVDLRAGRVYVNGCKLTEPYLLPNTPTFPNYAQEEQTILLGKDQFFVLGDNRNNSADSRTYGPVSRRSILGSIIR